jgi:hypothetical protein
MRDFVAAIVALALTVIALGLLTTLQAYRRRLARRRASEEALGRLIIAELPTAAELVLFSGDGVRFYHGDRPIEKDLIRAVRVLVNGSPIAAYVSTRWPSEGAPHGTTFENRPDGIARDRWDVALESEQGLTLIECGEIRERVSQELARRVYDAVRTDMEQRDRAASRATTRSR